MVERPRLNCYFKLTSLPSAFRRSGRCSVGIPARDLTGILQDLRSAFNLPSKWQSIKIYFVCLFACLFISLFFLVLISIESIESRFTFDPRRLVRVEMQESLPGSFLKSLFSRFLKQQHILTRP